MASTSRSKTSTGGGKTGTIVSIITGTSGDDVLYLTDPTYSEIYKPGAPTPSINGGGGKDIIYGRNTAESIDGGSSSDWINGGGGNDTLSGGSGTEVDWVSFQKNPRYATDFYADGVMLKLDQGSLNFDLLTGSYVGKILNFENVFGSVGHDLIEGDAKANEIRSGSGNDLVVGKAGNDVLYGNEGNDTIAGGDWTGGAPLSAEQIRGRQVGNDNNVMQGGAGDDLVISAIGNDWIDGGDGFDVVDYSYLPSGFLVRSALDGNKWTKVTVYTVDAYGNETVYEQDWVRNVEGIRSGGEFSNDPLTGDPNRQNNLDAGPGEDTVTGGLYDDTLDGGQDDDVINGGEGNDEILGAGGGNDSIDGGAGEDDRLSFREIPGKPYDPCGELGIDDKSLVIDLIYGDFSYKQSPDTALWYGLVTGIEHVTGAHCSDQIAGDSKNNILDGGVDGNDILYGAGGNDIIRGGKGSDWLTFQRVIDGNTPISRFEAGKSPADPGLISTLGFDAKAVLPMNTRILQAQADPYADGMTVDLSQNGGWYSYDVGLTKLEASGMENIVGSMGVDDFTGDSGAYITFEGIEARLVNGQKISFIYNGNNYSRTLTTTDINHLRAAQLPANGFDIGAVSGLGAGKVLASIVNGGDLRLIVANTAASVTSSNTLEQGALIKSSTVASEATENSENYLGFYGVINSLTEGDEISFKLGGTTKTIKLTEDGVAGVSGGLSAAGITGVTAEMFNNINLRLKSSTGLSDGVFKNIALSSDTAAGLQNFLTGADNNDVLRAGLGEDTLYGGAGLNIVSGGDDQDTFYVGYDYDPVADSLTTDPVFRVDPVHRVAIRSFGNKLTDGMSIRFAYGDTHYSVELQEDMSESDIQDAIDNTLSSATRTIAASLVGNDLWLEVTGTDPEPLRSVRLVSEAHSLSFYNVEFAITLDVIEQNYSTLSFDYDGERKTVSLDEGVTLLNNFEADDLQKILDDELGSGVIRVSSANSALILTVADGHTLANASLTTNHGGTVTQQGQVIPLVITADPSTDFIQDWENGEGLYVATESLARISGFFDPTKSDGINKDWSGNNLVDLDAENIDNLGTIVVATGAGNDTIFGSNGDDWIYAGSGRDDINLGAVDTTVTTTGTAGGDGADRVYIDSFTEKANVTGFDANDVIYIDKNLVDSFGSSYFSFGFGPDQSILRRNPVTDPNYFNDGRDSGYFSENGQARESGFITGPLFNLTYNGTIGLLEPSNGGSYNGEHLIAQIAAQSTSSLAAFTVFYVGYGLNAVPIVGPIIAIPFYVLSGLMFYEIAAINQQHKNPNYEDSQYADNLPFSYLTYMNVQKDNLGVSEQWDNKNFLDFYNADQHDGFTPTLQVQADLTRVLSGKDGIYSIVAVENGRSTVADTSDDKTFIYMVFSPDSLIQNNETILLAQVNGFLKDDQIRFYDSLVDSEHTKYVSGNAEPPLLPPEPLLALLTGDEDDPETENIDESRTIGAGTLQPGSKAKFSLSLGTAAKEDLTVTLYHETSSGDVEEESWSVGKDENFDEEYEVTPPDGASTAVYRLEVLGSQGLSKMSSFIVAIDNEDPELKIVAVSESKILIATSEDGKVDVIGGTTPYISNVTTEGSTAIITPTEQPTSVFIIDKYKLTDKAGNQVTIECGDPGDTPTIPKIFLGTGLADTLTGGVPYDAALYGFGGADSMTGGDGDDRLYGGAGNDSISAGGGADLVIGGEGADTLDFSDDGDADTLVINLADGTGIDTISGFGAEDFVQVVATDVKNFNPLEHVSQTSGLLSFNFDGAIGAEVSVDFGAFIVDGEKIMFDLTGSSNADTIEGGALSDRLDGSDGNDMITGGMGSDNLLGGDGNDTFAFAAGDTTISFSVTETDNGNDYSVKGYDEIGDFELGTDSLELGNAVIISDTVGTDGINVIGKSTGDYEKQNISIGSHSIYNGVITFDADDTFDKALTVYRSELDEIVDYLQKNVTTSDGVVAFNVLVGVRYNDNGTTENLYESYVFQSNGGTDDLLIRLAGVQVNNLGDLLVG